MKNKHTICICGAVLSLTLIPNNITVYGQNKTTSANDNYTFAKNNTYLLDESDNGEVQISETKNNLFKLLNTANQIYGDADIGPGDGQYPEDRAEVFQLVIQSANELYNTSDDDVEIARMITVLEDSMALFLASKIDLSTEKAILLSLITEVTELHNNAKVGKEIGDYPEEAKINLANAITLAEGVYNTPKVTKVELDNGTNSLETSKEMFLKSVIKEVDLSKLIAKITEMELVSQSIVTGNKPGQTPPESKLAFDSILSEAQQLVGNCTYQQSLEMVEKLDNAKKDLDDALITYEKINRLDLKEQIDIATDLKEKSTIGENPGDFPQESFTKLNDSIYEVTIVYGDYYASQVDIDNATAKIKLAILDFQSSIIQKENIDTTELEDLLLDAEKLLLETVIGNEINQVPESANIIFQNSIDNCKELLASSPTKQSEINDAISMLTDAISKFKDSIKKFADKTVLASEISKAVALQESITEDMIGDGDGQYPFSAKAKLDNAIIVAQEAFLSETITQSETDATVASLVSAVDSFKKSLISNVVDKTELKEVIQKAEQLLDEAVVGTQDGMYVKEVYNALSDAIKKATLTYESSSATQSTIDTQIIELELAISTFLKSENAEYKTHKDKLEYELIACEDIYNSSTEGEEVGQYPSSAMSAFKKAIDSAREVVKSNSKVSSDYTKALDNLNKARIKFEASVIDTTDLESLYIELDRKLKELSQAIKNADTTSEFGRVTENQKVALSMMYSIISLVREECEDVSGLKEAITLCEDTLSDFNDRSLFVDENNMIQGRKLTGVVGKNDTSRENVNIVSKTEFIPQAGLPLNVKGLLASIGTLFVALSGFMFKKKD